MSMTRTTPTPASQPTLSALVDAYDAELVARRRQLHSDRADFEQRLADLTLLDPADTTGLQNLYRAHIGQINLLLSEFDDAGVLPPTASA